MLIRVDDVPMQHDKWQDLVTELELHAQREWLYRHGDDYSGQKSLNKNAPPLARPPITPTVALHSFIDQTWSYDECVGSFGHQTVRNEQHADRHYSRKRAEFSLPV